MPNRTGIAIGVCATIAAVVTPLAAFAPAADATTYARAIRSARPTCHGLRATIVGTRHRDVIVGTNRRDVIVARGGWDTIFGRGGNDVICAGRGADVIFAGPGKDWVNAGPDGVLYQEDEIGDRVYASAGNDVLLGGNGLGSGRGLDLLSYVASKHRVRIDLAAHRATVGGEHDKIRGFELVHGSAHNDVILGTDGFEEMFGGGGNDIIKGRGGIDFIDGGHGDDRLSGGRGNDALSGGRGHDTAHGGAGEDFCTSVEQHKGCEHVTRWG